MVEGLAAQTSRPSHSARSVPCTARAGWAAMASAAQRVRSSNSDRGTTSVTSPTSRARSADIRSFAPSNDIRMTSWKGILCIRKMGSNAAGIP